MIRNKEVPRVYSAEFFAIQRVYDQMVRKLLREILSDSVRTLGKFYVDQKCLNLKP